MRIYLTLIVSILTVFFTSCNLEQKTYEAEINKMRDTLFQTFPSVNRVTVNVKQDFGKELEITLGDKTFYNASEEQRIDATNQVTEIVKQIFPADDMPEKGTVIFVQEENTLNVKESSQKMYKMDLGKK